MKYLFYAGTLVCGAFEHICQELSLRFRSKRLLTG